MAKLEQSGTAVLEPGTGGGFRDPIAPDGTIAALHENPLEPARTGIWVALAGIAMVFAALTSAMVVRERTGSDWIHLTLPKILFFNTLLLVVSSVALEVARITARKYLRGIASDKRVPLRWIYTTLVLGLAFVAGQYQAWLQLRAQGVYLATYPNSSFFYVFTGLHVVHVLGGLGGLLLVLMRLRRTVPTLRKSTFDATACYWHFMGGLWIYLLFLLWLKL
jgi:cytochrome c oxidase subunit 3